MSSVYLPEGIIDEILLRMQSKILILCKYVCKSWNARISNPAFMAQHLLQTQNQHDRILVRRSQSHPLKIVISLLSSDNASEFQDLPYDTTFDNTEERDDLRAGMTMLCCNHLLTIKPSFSNKIILWNPKETEFKILPQCHIPLDWPDADRSNSMIAFGFDSKTNDYKVLRMIKYGYDHVPYIVQIELYSLRTDSWRKMEDIPRINLSILSVGTIYINGMFYWYGSTKDVERVLWSFDMITELFNITRLPFLEDSNMSYSFLSLFLLNDRPAVIDIFIKSLLDVWVLLEHGVELSWTRLYRILYRPEIRFPVGSWKSGELFTESEDGGLWLYNPITQEIKNLNIPGNIYSFQIFKYRDYE